MKPIDFFITKANNYLTEIEIIDKTYIPYNYSGDFLSVDRQTPERTKQQKEISNLDLKIRLLFAEFDKGELFIAKLDKAKSNSAYVFDEKYILEYSKETLELFIEHLKDFRS
jgi:hypothetical protein